ncbi:MAG: DNA adenine methylase [Streptosporangiales bacterium]|nr:DNA adenine methylase [Streptosporangiales bacterium]
MRPLPASRTRLPAQPQPTTPPTPTDRAGGGRVTTTARTKAGLKPPFAYYGGKTTIAARIAALLPPHGHYVEPFGGSLAVLLAKRPSPMETVNDLDGDLMTFWRMLRDRPADLARACALTPHSRAEYLAARDLDGAPDDLERARRVWVWLSQARGDARRRTGWRHYIDPAGSTSSMPDYLAGYVARLAPAAARLARVSLECRPALEVIASYGPCGEACLYIDPPYLAATRRPGKYAYEMGSEADHRDLAEALHACRAAVVLSGYDHPLYSRLYAGWCRHEITTATGQGGAWAPRTEVLWSNRPLPTQDAGLFEQEIAS